MPVIPALSRLRQEDVESEACLEFTSREKEKEEGEEVYFQQVHSTFTMWKDLEGNKKGEK